MRSIIYRDEELNVIYRQGSSNYLLVIFGDMLHLTDNNIFYAEPVVKKLDISVICFTATYPNWFPEENVKLAYYSCKMPELLLKYQSIVVFGASMGGYAAIKYAKLLNAQHVLAYCPQFSLDPIECEGQPNGYEKYYSDKLKGMGIRKKDLIEPSKNIYIVYDPEHIIDNFHVNKILEENSNITMIKFYSGNHDVPKILAGTEVFKNIIFSILTNNELMFMKTISERRRAHPIRKFILLSKVIVRHPEWAVQLFERNYSIFTSYTALEANINALFRRFFNHHYNMGNVEVVKRLAKAIQSTIYLSSLKYELKGHINNGSTKILPPNLPKNIFTLQNIQSIINKWENRPHDKILTFHKTMLCLDLIFMQLSNYSAEVICNHPYRYIPVFINWFAIHPYLVVFYNQNYQICILESDNKTIKIIPLSKQLKIDNIGYTFSINEQEKYFHLTSQINGLNCSAEIDGEVAWNRPFLYGWETFFIN